MPLLCAHGHTWAHMWAHGAAVATGPSTSPTLAAPCAGAGAAGDSWAVLCSLQVYPHGEAQQQGQKQPVTEPRWMMPNTFMPEILTVCNYIEILPPWQNLHSIQSIRCSSVFSDHFTTAWHPPQSDQVAAAALHRSVTPPCKRKPLIKWQWGAQARLWHGSPTSLCHGWGARTKWKTKYIS